MVAVIFAILPRAPLIRFINYIKIQDTYGYRHNLA